MKTKIYNLETQEVKSIDLAADIFGVKKNNSLLSLATKVFSANQRKSLAKAKTRAEISGSGKKIWRQKGTGRARHGDRYAPIFVGGGKAHGPTGKENWALSLPKKMRQLALKIALSEKFKKGQIILVDNFSVTGEKTKKAFGLLSGILKKNSAIEKDISKLKISLVFARDEKQAQRPFANLNKVKILEAGNLDPYGVLDNNFLILGKEALVMIEKRLAKGKDD